MHTYFAKPLNKLLATIASTLLKWQICYRIRRWAVSLKESVCEVFLWWPSVSLFGSVIAHSLAEKSTKTPRASFCSGKFLTLSLRLHWVIEFASFRVSCPNVRPETTAGGTMHMDKGKSPRARKKWARLKNPTFYLFIYSFMCDYLKRYSKHPLLDGSRKKWKWQTFAVLRHMTCCLSQHNHTLMLFIDYSALWLWILYSINEQKRIIWISRSISVILLAPAQLIDWFDPQYPLYTQRRSIPPTYFAFTYRSIDRSIS